MSFSIDCRTCPAANTTACNECVLTHVVANDSGPIDLVVVPEPTGPAPVERAVDLFVAAGLCGDSPAFVSPDDFDP